MKFCKLDDDEVFDVTSIFNVNIDALAAVITLSYKPSFKFINQSFKPNSETNYVLSFKIVSEALIKPATLSH